MDPLFVKTLWATLIMLWVALIILYFILTSRKSLERKGHHEKYIAYLRKSHLIRICLIAVVLPLLIMLSGWIIYRLTGPLKEEAQLAYIVVVLLVLVIPFKWVDERINQKRIRELALDTHEKIAVDLNYKTLHLIFNPLWEAVLAPLALLYGIYFLQIEQWIIYLFLLIPWFMYLNIRGTKYQTRPYLRDNYKYMFAFNIFNFLFFLLYFCSYFLIRLQQVTGTAGSRGGSVPVQAQLPSYLLLLAGFLIIMGLLGRIAVYLSNYSSFNRAMNGEQGRTTSSLTRKMVFLAAGIMILFSLSGVAIITGMLKGERIEVGVVQGKYVVHDHLGRSDTLLVIKDHHPLSGEDFLRRDYPGDLKMSCEIRLSRSDRTRNYDICCLSLFNELPVGTIVKFEYTSGSSITQLVDY